jgi:hypothetical protein
MKLRITVTYRRGKRVLTKCYTSELKSPICTGIELSGEPLQAVAWNDVISIVVVKEPAPHD